MIASYLIWISIGLVAIWLATAFIFYFFQDLFFFRPEKLPTGFQYKYPFPFQEVHFQMEDGAYVNGLMFHVPNAKGVVYYLKGNSKSVKGWGKFARDFIGKGYDFFMVDYRGFGKSYGKRNQEALFNDAQYLYKWLNKHYTEDKIVVYGRSYGTGIAARIASWNDPKMLILDSPYYSFYHNIRRYGFFLPLRWLLKYPLHTNQYMKSITCPIHIIHGRNDFLIPFKQSEKLKQEFGDKINLIAIQQAHHNDLPDFREYHDALYELLHTEIS